MKTASRLAVRLAGLKPVTNQLRTLHTVQSSLPSITIPPLSVPDYIWSKTGFLGERVALESSSGAQLSYADLRARSKNLASWLHGRLPPDSAIVLLLPNCPEMAVAVLAGLEAGAVVCPLSPEAEVDQVSRALASSRSPCIFATSSKVQTVLEAKKGLEKLSQKMFPVHIILTDRNEKLSGFHCFRELCDSPKENSINKKISDGDTALMLLKGDHWVRVSHRNIVASCLQISQKGVCPIEESSSVAAIAPLHTGHSLTQVLLNSLSQAARLVTFPSVRSGFLQELLARGITVLPVGSGLLHQVARLGLDQLSFLESVMVEGPVDREDIARVARMLAPGARLMQFYSLPEGTLFYVEESGGRLLPSTEAKVLCPASGEELPAGSPGDLWFRGPQLKAGAWLYSGLLGHYSPDGTITLTGSLRRSRPDLLQYLLQQHPDVGDSAVFPFEGSDGPLVAAVVPRDPDTRPSSDQLLQFLEARFLPPHRLTKIILCQEIPRTANGQVDLKKLASLQDNNNQYEFVALPYI